jgi:hypothetical protein
MSTAIERAVVGNENLQALKKYIVYLVKAIDNTLDPKTREILIEEHKKAVIAYLHYEAEYIMAMTGVPPPYFTPRVTPIASVGVAPAPTASIPVASAAGAAATPAAAAGAGVDASVTNPATAAASTSSLQQKQPDVKNFVIKSVPVPQSTIDALVSARERFVRARKGIWGPLDLRSAQWIQLFLKEHPNAGITLMQINSLRWQMYLAQVASQTNSDANILEAFFKNEALQSARRATMTVNAAAAEAYYNLTMVNSFPPSVIREVFQTYVEIQQIQQQKDAKDRVAGTAFNVNPVMQAILNIPRDATESQYYLPGTDSSTAIEQKVVNWFHQQGVKLLNEKEQKLKTRLDYERSTHKFFNSLSPSQQYRLYRATPDILFTSPVVFNGQQVVWADVKAFLGFPSAKNIKQLSTMIKKYVDTFRAPGLILLQGYTQKLLDDVRQQLGINYASLFQFVDIDALEGLQLSRMSAADFQNYINMLKKEQKESER